jgi:predicted N-formylglutamate amidohydrolase
MLDQAEELEEQDSGAYRPFIQLPGDIKKSCIILCDHACNTLPADYAALGLSSEQLSRHIAYDIGAAGVTSRLSELLGAPAVMANFSRLLIDPNRGPDDPTLIMRISDGAVVPGNAQVDVAEIERRKSTFYQPYHDAIDGLIDQAIAAQTIPLLLSVHSFTERFKDHARPWHAAVLWDKDDRLPRPLIDALRTEPDLIIGENEPYSGELKGDCLYQHGTKRGLAHALIELRQDLIAEPSGQRAWAERLAGVLTGLLCHPTLAAEFGEVRYYGSRTEITSNDQNAG